MNRTLIGAVLLSMSLGASAALESRLGGLAYYDTTLDITWLADANYAKTSGYDGDGRMHWADAVAWAAGLNINGITGWRLPTMLDTGAPGCSTPYDNTDCGYDVDTGSAATTVYSEMGSLYYDTLGNIGYEDKAGNLLPGGNNPSLVDMGPFSNVQLGDEDNYWTGVAYAPNPANRAWIFDFVSGGQYHYAQTNAFFAWAVHSGDVGAIVPLPPAAWLLVAPLLGLVSVARRKSAGHSTPA